MPHGETDAARAAPGRQRDVLKWNRIVMTVGVEDSAAAERAQGLHVHFL
jgi:hypothetical protein